MSNIKELLAISPENMAQRQHDALKAHAIKVLKGFVHRIESGKYDDMSDIVESPAGDECGCDNHYIDFDVGIHAEGDDIKMVLSKLSTLKQQAREE